VDFKQLYGTDIATRTFSGFFQEQIALLEKLYQYQFNNLSHLDENRIGRLYLLLTSIWHIGNSIELLAKYQHINEIYILARSFLERLITYTYLLCCDDKEYLRYLAYTKQKSYRITNRSLIVGTSNLILKRINDINLDNYSELKEAVNMFTSDKGKIKTHWTNQNLAQMLDIISTTTDINISYLMVAIVLIYDDASEALHGTLYGALFHIGIFDGKAPSSKDELRKELNRRLSTLFLSLGTCIHTLIQAFHRIEKIDNYVNESSSNLKSIGYFGEKGFSEIEELKGKDFS
jgi:hypothetical protein